MERLVSTVESANDKVRLDRFLASICPDVSRSAIQRWIRGGAVRINDEIVRRASHRVRTNDVITCDVPETNLLTPREIPLDVLYEDEALVALDKPTGLVVHPGAGTKETTLVEGLLATRSLPASDDPARPGIVHRLDKATSGVIVVAKTAEALSDLQRQFAERRVSKSYLAVVDGVIREEEGKIDAPVGRDPARPSRMAILPKGKPAETEFEVLERQTDRTLLWVRPQTGRTHQIRAHLQYIKHPVVGDEVYGRAGRNGRMLLHAWRLVLSHPVTDEELRFEAAVPPVFPDYRYEELPWSRIPEIA
jgi:23S rRNA pseudouridine1911/1915/1917 synthase